MKPLSMPGAVPLLGHLPALARRPLEFLCAAQARRDVVALRLGVEKAYFVNQPEHLRTLLVTDPARFDKGVQFEKAAAVIGNSLPVSSGAFHRRQRKMIRPAFLQARLREYFEVMLDCSETAARQWSADVDIADALRDVVGAITAKTLFSPDFPDDVRVEFTGLVGDLDKGVALRVLDPTGLVGRLPLPVNRRFAQARDRTHELMETFIAQYRRLDDDRHDLMSTLLAARDDGHLMPDRQVRDEAIAIMQAGFETTARALCWATYVLGQHPDLQRQVRDEVEGVGPLSYEDLPRLDLTRRVVTEALRMYPPLYLMTRRAIEDVRIGEHTIPRGSTVLFSPYALHHDPVLYPDPSRFDPDRWLPGGRPSVEGVTYLPFGAGLRNCLGERFAMMEMIVVLSAIVRRWTLEPIPGVPVRPKLSFVLAPSATGVRLSLPAASGISAG